ncbi:MAG: NACHT domain-containing protein, partial [Pseudonocardiaceae bacterium]
MGEVGSGKTWFLKDLYLTLLQAFQEDHSNSFPQFIDLGKTLTDLGHPSWPWDWQSLVTGDFANNVILLDAYDEAVAKSRPGARLLLLQAIVSLASSSNRLVITSRTHLFETSTRLLRLIEAAIIGARSSDNLHTEVFFIDRLRDEDQREFLRTEFDDRDGTLWKRLTEVIDLADLAKRPILLPMVCESLPAIRTQPGADPITAGHLYRIYIEKWLARESWRLGIGSDSARRFFESLAQDFHNSGSRSIFFDELPERFPEYFPQVRFSAERESVLEALRAANFLVYDLNGSYSFIHLSFI